MLAAVERKLAEHEAKASSMSSAIAFSRLCPETPRRVATLSRVLLASKDVESCPTFRPSLIRALARSSSFGHIMRAVVARCQRAGLRSLLSFARAAEIGEVINSAIAE